VHTTGLAGGFDFLGCKVKDNSFLSITLSGDEWFFMDQVVLQQKKSIRQNAGCSFEYSGKYTQCTVDVCITALS